MEALVTFINPAGLHARPAVQFSAAAMEFKNTRIKIKKDGREADGKSILSIFSLGILCGTTVTIRTEGPEEEQAIRVLVRLVAGGFGELV